jgi:hypothetical protein
VRPCATRLLCGCFCGCFTAALLLLYCCFDAVLLLLCGCFTAALLLLYCCFCGCCVAAALLLLSTALLQGGARERGQAALLLLYCCFTAALLRQVAHANEVKVFEGVYHIDIVVGPGDPTDPAGLAASVKQQ